MRSSRLLLAVFVLVLLAAGFLPGLATAGTKTFDFALDSWHQMDDSEGAVTVHRIRLVRIGAKWTSSVSKPDNHENLQRLEAQVEYSNEADRKWTVWVKLRIVDEEGREIDSFSTKSALAKQSARRIITPATITTLKYGLERAKTLEVQIMYQP